LRASSDTGGWMPGFSPKIWFGGPLWARPCSVTRRIPNPYSLIPDSEAEAAQPPTPSHFLRRSRMMASRASMISSRVARVLAKEIFRLKALVGGRQAKT
jgi:hypothetical protein